MNCVFLSNVSTHSRPKAAGPKDGLSEAESIGFNTQPPEGGWARLKGQKLRFAVSTHSRPKAAGSWAARGVLALMFQHTAARRRLVP